MTIKASIIGKGAIGSLIAARCKHLDIPVSVWWRSGGLNGKLTLKFLDGSRQQLVPSAPEPTDLLIVPTKAWQVKDALRQHEKYLKKDGCIVLLHNGIGTEEDAMRCFPSNPILRMTTSRAALKTSCNEIHETGHGATQAGWLKPPIAAKRTQIENLFDRIMTDCQWFEDIRTPLWQKLAVNCVINPLTAVHDIKNGELRKPRYRDDIEKLLEEFFMVAALEKVPLDKAQTTQKVWTVIEQTAQNYSSMHQDVEHGRETEIDFINGYLVAIARSKTLELPLNTSLLHAIRNK